MKKLMLILVVTGILISCSSKDEIIKKETVVEVVVENETTIPNEKMVEVETAKVITIEVEEFSKIDEDYKTVSEPTKKWVKKVKTNSKPVKKEIIIEEEPVELVEKVSIDKDIDKLIAMKETEAKSIEEQKPKEEESSNKTLFGVLGAILVAAAAVFVFKKK